MRGERPVLEACDLRKVFSRKGAADKVAVDGVSLSVRRGECVGVVGESGSGKSTVANMVLRLIDPTEGRIMLNGRDITALKGVHLRGVYRSMQAVFQDPAGSFDPRRTLGASIAEGMRNVGVSRQRADARVKELLALCGLPEEMAARYPREVSGGQCQRAAIARALALEPDLLICDEATSALDVTVQRQVVELLARLKEERAMALLFICHDIALVSEICDTVVVMKDGAVVESGSVVDVIGDPKSDYTKTLLEAVL